MFFQKNKAIKGFKNHYIMIMDILSKKIIERWDDNKDEIPWAYLSLLQEVHVEMFSSTGDHNDSWGRAQELIKFFPKFFPLETQTYGTCCGILRDQIFKKS